ncbi:MULTISPECIES: hypothetical protein [Rhodococcus]|uniref:hypothetical protein n=1 Tax=Rhodococcus TaxID=1827 RepID=UPI0007DA0D04|nr:MULTISPECIES: hypothetical protein [Rhodococcus]WAL49570.1 hypothetical protein OQN32_27595 [Rhodococcus pyridinivorans]
MNNNVVLRAGFFGCTHAGYGMRGMARKHPSGLNIREVDGYVTYELVQRDMIASEVNFQVNGGDTFHVHHPPVRAVNAERRIDALRITAGIPAIANTGNHDVGAGTSVSAAALLHQPELGRCAVFVDPARPDDDMFGPVPGYYEVHQPVPEVPLFLHVVSHSGLDPRLQERGIEIDPRPISGGVNILVSHGIFSADGRLFGADDRHGAERLVPEEWADRGWDQTILSDYHTPGPIPGFGPADGRERGQVWMTGSLIGRGFSDDICDRGWLLMELTEDGRVTVTPRYVWRRPQIDFDVIDARGKTIDDINLIVRERLASQDWWDDESAELTGDGGYILRQKIAHTTNAQRHGIRALAAEWAVAAGRAAYWAFAWEDPLPNNHGSSALERTSRQHNNESRPRSLDLAHVFTERLDQGRIAAILRGMAEDIRKPVIARTQQMLHELTPTDPR